MNKLLLGLMLLISTQVIAQKGEKFFPSKELTTVGAYYYPEHWDSTQWDRDFQNMAKMGFEFTHFAEFAWAQLEPEEGRYDFKWLDRAVELATKYNLKVVMCTSTATPPVWLVRKHPEILVKNEDETTGDHGSRQNASFSSTIYRQYSLKMVKELAKRYGNNQQIIGWQMDNEPRKFFDYNDDAQLRFREWLKNKYKTIDALNKAWGTNFWSGTYSDFQQINVPLYKMWGMNLHQKLDHSRFSDYETASFLDEQAVVVRKYASASQWITSNYIPMYDVGYDGMSHELDFPSYTRYMVYGEAQGIGRNGYRLGEYSRIAMANDFFRPMAGYYGVMELQPGQVNWGSINAQPLPGAVRLWLWNVFAGGSKFTCTYRYRAPLYGYEQYHYGIVGTDGVTPTSGGKEFSQFIQEINILRKKYNSQNTLPKTYTNRKTGILFNADNVMAINLNKQTTEWNTEAHFLKYYKSLKSFGAPVDFIRDTTNFSEYPFIVVPAYQQIDKQLIAKLTSYAENGGHLVMTCRTGHQDRDGHLWEAPYAQPIYDLIGAEINSYDLLMPQSPDSVRFEGKPYAWTSWGELLNPRKGTEIWAKYEGDFYAGTSAVTSRKLGRGTVTYVGVDSKSGDLEKKVLSRLFKESAVAVESYPPGIITEYRDGFGIAMNYRDKNYEMKLPASSEIIFGNQSIAQGGVLVWKY
ncbi:MAG TPA: beta-galactosidase [Prolixibacteraceae bacterium]|nr:beta-galactosidase [Prolixibacteraceae bacterium]